MEFLPKELEQQVIDLLKKNKLMEAVALVQKEMKCGLKNSKNIVDKYMERLQS